MRKIIYYGASSQIGTLISGRCTESIHKGDILLDVNSFEELSFYTHDDDYDEKALIIDLSPWDEVLFPNIIPTLRLLEKDGALKKTKVYLILGTEPCLSLKANLAACSLIDSYFVIGGDEDVFIRFLLKELKIDDDNDNRYACLSGIETKLEFNLPFQLLEICKNGSFLQTPCEFRDKTFPISGGLLERFNQKRLELSQTEDKFRYKFTLPFKKSSCINHKWDIDEALFLKQVNRNKSAILQKNGDILILGCDERAERISKLLDYEANANVHYMSELESFGETISKMQPDIIFLRVQDEAGLKSEEEDQRGFRFEDLPKVVGAVKGINHFDPIVIVLNSPSHSMALRQVFRYDKIIAFEEELSREFILELIKKFNEKNTLEFSLNVPLRPLESHLYACGWLEDEMTLHTLSENLVSFSYEHSIAVGTWINLTFPFPITIKILEEGPSRLGPKFKQFTGRILGLTAETEATLRVFINLAFNDPKDFIEYYKKHPQLLKENIDQHLFGNGFEVDYGKEKGSSH